MVTIKNTSFYPLGEDLYACVKRRKNIPRIYVARYQLRTDVKGGWVTLSPKRITMSLENLKRLVAVKTEIIEDYQNIERVNQTKDAVATKRERVKHYVQKRKRE